MHYKALQVCFIKSLLRVCCFSKFFTPPCTVYVYAAGVMINLPRTAVEMCVRLCECHTVSVNPLVCVIVCLNVFNKHHSNLEWWCEREKRKDKKERKHISVDAAFHAQKRFFERHFNGWSFRSFTNCVNFVIPRALARSPAARNFSRIIGEPPSLDRCTFIIYDGENKLTGMNKSNRKSYLACKVKYPNIDGTRLTRERERASAETNWTI